MWPFISKQKESNWKWDQKQKDGFSKKFIVWSVCISSCSFPIIKKMLFLVYAHIVKLQDACCAPSSMYYEIIANNVMYNDIRPMNQCEYVCAPPTTYTEHIQ